MTLAGVMFWRLLVVEAARRRRRHCLMPPKNWTTGSTSTILGLLPYPAAFHFDQFVSLLYVL
jgi:hypothetical protein